MEPFFTKLFIDTSTMGEGESGELVTEKMGTTVEGSFFLSSRPEKRFASYYTLSRHMERGKKTSVRCPYFQYGLLCDSIRHLETTFFLHGVLLEKNVRQKIL